MHTCMYLYIYTRVLLHTKKRCIVGYINFAATHYQALYVYTYIQEETRYVYIYIHKKKKKKKKGDIYAYTYTRGAADRELV